MTEVASPWTIVSSRTPYQNNWMRIREDKVVTPTGKDGIYAVLESNDSVKIVAVNDEGKLFLIHKFRYTDQTWTWELPGGGGDKEEPLVAAQREFLEETGIHADNWQKLGSHSLCDGFMTEREHSFLATGLHMSDKAEDSDEIITKNGFFSLQEIDEMIDTGSLDSGESLSSLYLYRRWLEKQQRPANA